jgi:hypothetical protein
MRKEGRKEAFLLMFCVGNTAWIKKMGCAFYLANTECQHCTLGVGRNEGQAGAGPWPRSFLKDPVWLRWVAVCMWHLGVALEDAQCSAGQGGAGGKDEPMLLGRHELSLRPWGFLKVHF